MPSNLYTLTLFAISLLPAVEGHGYMLMPPGRSSAWRMNVTSFYINYNDNENFCGGYGVQHNENNGQCGVCGDNYRDKVPRANERGGYYDTGNIVAEYASGDTIDVVIEITASHKGSFYFDICPSNHPKERETEKCFIPLNIADTLLPFYRLPHGEADTFHIRLQIPEGMTCRNCVLRWKYKTGNSWACENERLKTGCCVGCGFKQEYFYSCADIMITHTGDEGIPPWKKVDSRKTTTPKPTTSTEYTTTRTTTRRTTTRRTPPTTTRRTTTRRTPRPTTTRRTTRRTTTRRTTRRPTTPTTTRPLTTTDYGVCSVWCAKMCKASFNNFCSQKMCGDCPQFRRFIRIGTD